MSNWTLAQRAHKMNPSVIREILKVTERPGIISFAGGLPSPQTFPVAAFADACARVLRDDGPGALQYAASEGYAPLREWVAAQLPWPVDPAQVLITTGSQQGLDLVGKVLIDAGSRVLVETPTYLGALQAFAPMEPEPVGVASDAEGPDLQDMKNKAGSGAGAARFLYVLPNFQNPTGRSMSEARRAALVAQAAALGLPLVEDNPYGDLWFDQPPPLPLTARNPDGCIYLGSFSKVLAPGLRLGYLVAPKAVVPKLLQAKQAADLHSPSFNQRLVAEVLKDGFLDRHVPSIRALYKAQCQAMLAALQHEMTGLDLAWNAPDGGMFLWARLPAGMDAMALLPRAVDAGVAFVPGTAFYADHADPRTLRLSFRDGQRGADSRPVWRRWRRRCATWWLQPDGIRHGLRLWGRISSINVRKVVLCAQVLGAAVRTHRRWAGLWRGRYRRTTGDSNPNRLVPLLQDGDFSLWESNVVVRYLCRRTGSALYPRDLQQRSSTPSAGWTGSRPRSTARAVRLSSSGFARPSTSATCRSSPRSVAATEPLVRSMLDDHLVATGIHGGRRADHGRHPHRLRGAPLVGLAATAPGVAKPRTLVRPLAGPARQPWCARSTAFIKPSMKTRPFKQVDVFTATPYRGNPLAVVLDGERPRHRGHAALHELDQPVGMHLFAAADRRGQGARRRLPRAHLLPRARAAICRPSHARHLPCLAGSGRCTAR